MCWVPCGCPLHHQVSQQPCKLQLREVGWPHPRSHSSLCFHRTNRGPLGEMHHAVLKVPQDAQFLIPTKCTSIFLQFLKGCWFFSPLEVLLREKLYPNSAELSAGPERGVAARMKELLSPRVPRKLGDGTFLLAAVGGFPSDHLH